MKIKALWIVLDIGIIWIAVFLVGGVGWITIGLMAKYIITPLMTLLGI